MRVLITGSAGFLGRNLCATLGRRRDVELSRFELETAPGALDEGLVSADVVYHLAGVNRADTPELFREVNIGLTTEIVGRLKVLRKCPSLVFSSSTQAEQDNLYGRSKLAAERVLTEYSRTTQARVSIFRLPGVFGRWCRPNYNSVVATFCHNIARGLPIEISDPDRSIPLVHVTDVVAALERELDLAGQPGLAWQSVEPVFEITLGELAARIRCFEEGRRNGLVPDSSDPLERRLFATYQSYLPEDELSYALQTRVDRRGELAELAKSPRAGQIFVSRTRPGVTRGNHYHDLKVEKFFVIEGEALIRFRAVDGDEVREYRVSGSTWQAVDIPPGFTHSLENVGSSDLVVLFWASEPFDPTRPDTYGSEVLNG